MFEKFNLDENLLKGIREAGYAEPMAVQDEVIPLAIEGKDLMVQSQTGTGKTAAFLVPLYQMMMTPHTEGRSQALIVAPTRELAVQIEKEAIVLGKHIGLTTGCFYGGVGYNQQEKYLRDKVDVLIGTPGRLLDLSGQNKLDLSNVKYLVIDEADRMFDMGFYPDIRKIMGKIGNYKERQTMLFSATFDLQVQRIARDFMNHPEYISIDAEAVTVDTVNQSLFHVGRNEKIRLLIGLLKRHLPSNALIFSNTRQGAQMISRQLQRNGFQCQHLSGELAQSKRLEVIEKFKEGSLPFLVATDVAARGIHIDDLEWVVNFDLPADPESYVHRIGRTARAGKSGRAVSLVCETYVYHLEAIEQYIGQKIVVEYPEDDLFAPSILEDMDEPRGRGRSTVPPPKHRAKKSPQPKDAPKKPHRPKVSEEAPPIDSENKKTAKAPVSDKKPPRTSAAKTQVRTKVSGEKKPVAVPRPTQAPTKQEAQKVPHKMEDRLAYYQKKYGDQFNRVNGVVQKTEKKGFFHKIAKLFKKKA
jgi:ATP-dependent RNA helicase RhlB